MGNLETEAQRLEAFKRVYGPQIETENPQAGIARKGFELFWFDPETAYTQFRMRDRWHALNVTDQYVEYVLTPSTKTSVKRDRFYSARDRTSRVYVLRLNSATLSYQKGEIETAVHFAFPEETPGYPYPPYAQIEITAQAPEKFLLAKCWYGAARENGWPFSIELTTATSLEEAAKVMTTLTGQDRWNVVKAMAVSPRGEEFHIFRPKEPGVFIESKVGTIKDGQTLNDPETGYQVGVNLENHPTGEQLNLTRELNGHVLTLKVPRFDPEKWNDIVRGTWRNFANFPSDYPVNFDFPEG